MIAALLVLIVLILLFGAGVVKGWLANAVGYCLGGLVLLVAAGWLISFLGDDGFVWFVAGIGVAAALLWIGGAIYESWQREEIAAAQATLKSEEAKIREAQGLARQAEAARSRLRPGARSLL